MVFGPAIRALTKPGPQKDTSDAGVPRVPLGPCRVVILKVLVPNNKVPGFWVLGTIVQVLGKLCDYWVLGPLGLGFCWICNLFRGFRVL